MNEQDREVTAVSDVGNETEQEISGSVSETDEEQDYKSEHEGEAVADEVV